MPITTKTITWALIFFMSFLGAMMFPPVSNAAAPHNTGHILVRVKEGQDRRQAHADLHNAGGKLKKVIDGIDVMVVSVPAGKEQKIIDKLNQNQRFEYAELDTWGSATSTDAYFSNQWGLENTGQSIKDQAGVINADINAPEAWAVTTGQGVRVAVLDSGVDQNHEDISDKLVAQQNFTTATSVDDIYGHGTHVAGIIAAKTDNTTGVASVCPGCVIMNGKVLRDDGYGAVSWVSNGITWAANNNAKVINMSLGFNTPSKTLEKAVNYAWNKGVVVVASAGNGGNTAKEYPGAYTNVIAVAATNNRDAKASFSTYGSRWVDIAAPGENIFSTFPNHTFVIQTKFGRSLNYDFANGTSMSSPMVAGVAALVSTTSHGATAASTRNRIETTADKIVGTGSYWSAGRLNAARAVSQ